MISKIAFRNLKTGKLVCLNSLNTSKQLTRASWRSFSDREEDINKILTSIDPEREKFDNFLKNVPVYEQSLDDNLYPYFMNSEIIEGHATEKGTLRYMQRNDDEVPASNFRTPFNSDLKLSSVGIGTYVGAPDDRTDYYMYEAIKTSVLSGGVNVIDTAINYRYQKSERTIGKILNSLISKYGYERDELFVCSKGGFIPDDADHGVPGRIIVEDLIKEGHMDKSDVISGYVHCMHPKFLENQLLQSLKNMGLGTIDLYYLHNAYEMQGPNNTDNVVMDRFAAAFEFLEGAVEKGMIKNYGMATWLWFRAKPTEDKIYLNLQKIVSHIMNILG